MTYPNHNNHGRSPRPNPPGVDSHSGLSYAEQGTITLPLLTVTFPTPFEPPGLSLNFTSTHPNSTFTSLDTVPNNYQNPYPTQSRSTPVPYQQPYCTWSWPLLDCFHLFQLLCEDSSNQQKRRLHALLHVILRTMAIGRMYLSQSKVL